MMPRIHKNLTFNKSGKKLRNKPGKDKVSNRDLS